MWSLWGVCEVQIGGMQVEFREGFYQTLRTFSGGVSRY